MALSAQAAYARIQELLKEEDDLMEIPPETSHMEEADLNQSFALTALQEQNLIRSSSGGELVAARSPKRAIDSHIPAEKSFHEVLSQYFEHYGYNPDTSMQSYTSLVGNYANIAQKQLEELNAAKRRNLMGFTDREPSPATSLALRAERDLWGLLQMLSEHDLLGQIDEDLNAIRLEEALGRLEVRSTTIPDYIHTAYEADDRLKRLAIVQSWLQNSALDDVKEIPITAQEPWADTIHLMRIGKAGPVSSPHPDAQLAPDGQLLPLSGMDGQDQEALHTYLLQLLRAGQILKAKEVCVEQRVYWLGAILGGVFTHQYEETEGEGEEGGERGEEPPNRTPFLPPQRTVRVVGNVRQPLFVQTCYEYASHLSQCPLNFNMGVGERIGRLEMCLYAVLSNHLEVLERCGVFSTSWQDEAWRVSKAVHDVEVSKVVQRYRRDKSQIGRGYSGCDEQTLRVERDVIDRWERELEKRGGKARFLEFGDLDETKEREERRKGVVSLLYEVQKEVLRGKGLGRYFGERLPRLLEDPESGDLDFWRVVTHLLLWVRGVPRESESWRGGWGIERGQGQVGQGEREGEGEGEEKGERRMEREERDKGEGGEKGGIELLYRVIERYLSCLIERRVFSLVPLYASYLPPLSSLSLVGGVLRTMRGMGLGAEEEREVLGEIERLFSLEERREILRESRGEGKEERGESLYYTLLSPFYSEAMGAMRRLLPSLSREEQGRVLSSLSVEYLEEGWRALLEEREKEVKEVQERVYERDSRALSSLSTLPSLSPPALSSPTEREVRRVEKREALLSLFRLDLLQVSLSRRLSSLEEERDALRREVEKYRRERESLLLDPSLLSAGVGRHYPPLSLFAREMLKSVKEFLNCQCEEVEEVLGAGGEAGGEGGEVSGYLDIWLLGERHSRRVVEAELEEVGEKLEAIAREREGRGERAQGERGGIEGECAALLSHLLSLLQNPDLDLQNLAVKAQALLLSLQSLPEEEEGLGRGREWVGVLSSLRSLGDYVEDLGGRQRERANAMLYRVLRIYLEVCMETGEVCSAFSREEAAQWYEEAVDLSVLLASNDFSLQLHSLLTSEQLREVLGMMRAAALKRMDLQLPEDHEPWV